MAKVYLSTIGAKMGYAFEAVAGQRPTADYIDLEGVKSTSEMNPEPDTLEVTTLNEQEYKIYIEGLKDLGGALGFGFGKSAGFAGEWNTFCEEAKTKAAQGLACWFTIWVPGDTEATFFTGTPSKVGMAALEVNSAYDITVNIVPTGEPVWATPVEPTAQP